MIWKGRPALPRESFLSRRRKQQQCFFRSREIAGQTNPVKLPPFLRLKEIAVRFANVCARCRARAATQNILIAHELAVVFAERTRPGPVTGVRRVGTASPLPNVAEHLLETAVGASAPPHRCRMKPLGLYEVAVDLDFRRGAFPFKFCWQPGAGPVRVGVGFEITEMRDRFVWVDLAQTGQSKIPPFAVPLDPIKRGAPVLFVDGGPA